MFSSRRQPVPLLFVHPPLSTSSENSLKKNDKVIEKLNEIITTYFEVYVSPNLKRMQTKLRPELIINILDQTSYPEDQFNMWLMRTFGTQKNTEVKQLCSFLRHLVRGELTTTDILLQALIKSNTIQPFTVKQYNWLISQKISNLINNYLVNELDYNNLNQKEIINDLSLKV